MKIVINKVYFVDCYSWRLYAHNGRPIADSGAWYKNYKSCYAAARRMIKLLEPNYVELVKGVSNG